MIWFPALLQRLSVTGDQLEATQLQLKQLPSSTHTLQAIMEAKVGLNVNLLWLSLSVIIVHCPFHVLGITFHVLDKFVTFYEG